MKISYNWLKELVKTELNPDELAKILTATGLEVEGVEEVEAVKGGLKGVVVGEVLTCEKHENADKLNVTTVNVGEDSALQIVCGAPNVAVGQKVVVATVGSVLYPKPDEEFKIKKSKIRGVESFGMICAEDELGLGTSHDGIMVLDDTAPIGQDAATFFNLSSDYLIEIGLTPNRSDALGHLGVARDLIAYLNVHENANLSINWPDVEDLNAQENSLKIEVQSKDLASKYMGAVISNVIVKTSPDWLKNILLTIGLQPKNNIVDITNYVMHELGTPLHAFDLKCFGEKVVVRTAKNDEQIITLDDEVRKLNDTNLIIANENEPLCIAGVLGGKNSGVNDQTTDIFLEAACFDAVSIRKTAKQFGLNTDASFRFERGVDPELVEFALRRAVYLIQTLAEGKLTVLPLAHNEKLNPAIIDIDIQAVNRLIGKVIPHETIEKILINLDFKILSKNEKQWKLQSPSYRVDVLRPADVTEEILRIYGFNNVDLPEKMVMSLPSSQGVNPTKVESRMADFLASNGAYEIMNNSLTQSKYVAQFGREVLQSEHNVEMLNPLSQELDVMRQSLIFQTLEVVQHNQNRQQADLKIFEFGKVYKKFSDKYEENKRLLLAISGKVKPESWLEQSKGVSFYTLKGIFESMMNVIGLNNLVHYKPIKKSLLSDGVEVYILKDKIGELGWVSQELKKYFGVKSDVFVADIDFDALLSKIKMNKVIFSELPKTFAVRRDFSLLLDNEVQFQSIVDIAKAVDKKLLQEVNLFDVYEGKNLPDGKKSYAVSFIFQDKNQTLKDKQIDSIMDKIYNQLAEKLNASLR